MEALLGYSGGFTELMRDNPVVAGFVSLWALTLVTVLCRNVPKALWEVVYRQTTITLTISREGFGFDRVHYDNFMHWFMKTHWSKHSRSVSLSETTNLGPDATLIGAGFGFHFFMFRGRPFWFRKIKLESTGSAMEKEEVTIRTIGRSQKPILDLIETVRYKPNHNEIGIYTLDSINKEWKRLVGVRERPLETVIVRRSVKETMLDHLDHFFGNQEWYYQRGVAYKRTMVLHGPPGSGKTSLVKSLASHYNRNIYLLSLHQVSDTTLPRVIADIPKGSFLLIEDFDSTSVVNERDLQKRTKDLSTDSDSGEVNLSPITLSGILNALDGVISLDDIVVVMTTNHIENIDEALLRKGRVDDQIYLGALGHQEVCEYIHQMYPEARIPDGVIFEEVMGCELHDLFLTHRENWMGFIGDLKVATSGDHESFVPMTYKMAYRKPVECVTDDV